MPIRILALLLLLIVCVSGSRAQERAQARLLSRENLLGSWGGLRPLLEEHGISLELVYTFDLLSNVTGGIRRETEALGNIDLFVTAELDPLLGWRGGRFFLYGLGNHGGSISKAVGDAQGVDNIEAPKAFKLYEAWLEQEILDHRLSVLAGLYDVNSEFDVIPAASVFLNSSHGIGADFGLSGRNGPSIFPTTSLGTRLRFRPSDSVCLRGVIADGVPGDPGDPTGTRIILDHDDGLLMVAEVGFLNLPSEVPQEVRELPPEERRYGNFGKFAVGVWKYTGDLDDLLDVHPSGAPLQRKGNPGVYALAEQRVYHEPDDPFQGLSLFARLGIADDRVNPIEGYLGAGLMVQGLIPGRNEDRAGVAFAAARFASDFKRASSTGRKWEDEEVALELTYLVQVSPWCYVQPDLQHVIHPGGDPDLDDATVVGVRVSVSF
jgi:porin